MDSSQAAQIPEEDPDFIRFCCVSDTHSFTDNLTLQPGDVLIHCGDFTVRGTKEEILKFAEWLAKQPYRHKIVISGNHELTLDRDRYEKRLLKFQNKPTQLENMKKNLNPDNFIKHLTDIDGCQYLEHQGIEIYGYKLFATPFVSPVSDWAFMLKNDERKQKYQEIPSDTEILVTHMPPHNILDAKENVPDNDKLRFGCQHLRNEVLNRIKPMYHMFGHNHDGYGQMTIDGINFINCATCDEDYQPVNAPVYFQLPKNKADYVVPQGVTSEQVVTEQVASIDLNAQGAKMEEEKQQEEVQEVVASVEVRKAVRMDF